MANKIKTRNFPVDMWRTNLMQVKMTAEDRFFWVYINTNPQVSLLGIYPLTVKQIAFDLGYHENAVKALIRRFTDYHKLIKYNFDTGEIAILDYVTWGIKSGGKPILDALNGAYDALEDKTLVKDVYDHLVAHDKRIESVVTTFFEGIDFEKMKKLKAQEIEEKRAIEAPKKEAKKNEKFNAKHEIERSNLGDELKEAMYAFLESRKAQRAPVSTQRALNGLLNSLDRLGNNEAEKIKIVDQSTENGWKGFFPLKEYESYGRKTNTSVPEWYQKTDEEKPNDALLEKALAMQKKSIDDCERGNQEYRKGVRS